MITQPTVSVVVSIYNGGEHYATCFRSLCDLHYPTDLLDVHIVDDCSTDGTREFLRRQSPPGFIHRHYPETNLGRTRVCNLGLGYATGEVIILLDGDMEVRPDFVAAQVAELSKPGRAAVVGRVEPAPWLPKSKLNRYLYESPHRGARQFGAGKPIGFQYMIFNNAALSRAALEAGGRFEESFTNYGGKDILFAYRVARAFPNGIYYNAQAVSFHHQHRSLGAYLKLLTSYGRHNLPQIVTRHPEIATPLAADFAWPFPGKYFRRKRTLGRLLFNRLSYLLARALLPFIPVPLSHGLVRFLSVTSVVRGLRRYVKDHRPQIPHPGASRKSPTGPTTSPPAR